MPTAHPSGRCVAVDGHVAPQVDEHAAPEGLGQEPAARSAANALAVAPRSTWTPIGMETVRASGSSPIRHQPGAGRGSDPFIGLPPVDLVEVPVVAQFDQGRADGWIDDAGGVLSHPTGHLEGLEQQWADRNRAPGTVRFDQSELGVGAEPAAGPVEGPELIGQQSQGLIGQSAVRHGHRGRGADGPHRAGGDRTHRCDFPDGHGLGLGGGHDCPDTVAAELLDDFGAVVVVVAGVVVVVVGLAPAEVPAAVVDDDVPVDDCPETVMGEAPVVEEAAAVGFVVAVDTDDEWAVAPEATTTPRPAAAAEAATPMATVVRRTRVMARSRACAAAWGEGRRSRGGAMADLSGRTVGSATERRFVYRCHHTGPGRESASIRLCAPCESVPAR